jgi:hypothetical protein
MRENSIWICLPLQLTIACNEYQTRKNIAGTACTPNPAVPGEATVADFLKTLDVSIFHAVRKADADLLISYFRKSPTVNFVDQDAVIVRGYDSLHATFKQGYIPIAYQSIPRIEQDVHVISDRYAIGTEATDYTFTVKKSCIRAAPMPQQFYLPGKPADGRSCGYINH